MNRASPRPRFATLLLVFLLNPMLYAWWHTAGGTFPDSIAYLQMSKDIIDHGKLFVAPWGHVDKAVILPPVYPLVIGAFSLLHHDPINVSQWINQVALLLCVLPFFLWIERAANLYVAAAAAIAVQWQPFYLNYGTLTLTEALFLLGICSIAVLAGTLLTRAGRRPAGFFALGLSVGVLFLVRQIGLFLLPVLIVMVAILSLRKPPARMDVTGTALHVGGLVLGFLAVLGPYSWALHAQTGQMPWTASFRLNQYVVAAATPGATLEESSRKPVTTYVEAYAERRVQRQLLPDASEMQAYVQHGPVASPGPLHWLTSMGEWLRNLAANVGHAAHLAGGITVALAGLGIVLSLLRAGPEPARPWRLLLPAVLLGYLVLLSALSGLVQRYVEVILPFVIAQAAVGIYLLVAEAARRQPLSGIVWVGVGVVTVGSVMLSAPGSVLATPLLRKVGETSNPMAVCRPLVRAQEGIFSFHPLEAYLLGGSFRLVPNDSLDRIATYGRATGTRWLLFRLSSATEREALLNEHAGWIRDPRDLVQNRNLAARCGSPSVGAVLFEIIDSPPP